MSDKKTAVVYAMKGRMKTTFTETIWKQMGADKNGWVEVTQSMFESNRTLEPGKSIIPDSVNEDLNSVKNNDTKNDKDDTVSNENNAKNDENESNSNEGDSKSNDESAKSNEGDSKQVDENSNENDRSQYKELIENAKNFEADNMFEDAIELYEQAHKLNPTKTIAKKIESLTKKIK